MSFYKRVLSYSKRKFFDISFLYRRPLKGESNGNDLGGFETRCLNFISGVERYKRCQPKIGVVYRLKNASLFLEMSVLSVLPIASEIIFVDNGSEDSTVDLINYIIEKYSSRVEFKYFTYEKSVHRQGKDYRRELESDPSGSLADYYNFCFSKTDCEYVMKMDAHKYLLPEVFNQILSRLENSDDVVFMRGYDFYGRSISYEPLIYRNSPDVYYVDGEYFEYLDYSAFKLSKSKLYDLRIDDVSFLHVKSLSYPSLA